MEVSPSSQKAGAWVAFLAVILLLVGVYGAVRTIVNFFAFEKYPTEGVYGVASSSFNPFSGCSFYGSGSSEYGCSSPTPYYDESGNPREATEAEKESEKQSTEYCLQGVQIDRGRAKVNDISQSLIFLVLGAGAIVARKIFFKTA